MITSFEKLAQAFAEKKGKNHPPKAAIIGADDATMLQIVLDAKKNGIVKPLLLGQLAKIDKVSNDAGMDMTDMAYLECADDNDLLQKATGLAINKQVDLLVCGTINPRSLLAYLVKSDNGFRSGKNRLSHVAAFETAGYPKLLLMTDGAINVAPDIPQKLAIIQNAVKVANSLGVDMPKVAMLAAVEVIYPGMRVTEEGAIISKMVDKGQIKNCLIDGPLSWDVATVPEVAKQKGAVSEVAGQADIMAAPNIETGHGIYTAMSLFVKARCGGVVTGGACPLAFPSRCDTPENIAASILLAAWLVQ